MIFFVISLNEAKCHSLRSSSISAMFCASILPPSFKAPIKEVGWRQLYQNWNLMLRLGSGLPLCYLWCSVLPPSSLRLFTSLAGLLPKKHWNEGSVLVQSTARQYVFNFLTWDKFTLYHSSFRWRVRLAGVLYPYLKERYGRNQGAHHWWFDLGLSWHLSYYCLRTNLSPDTILFIFLTIMAITMGFVRYLLCKKQTICLPAFGHRHDTLGPLTLCSFWVIAGNVKPLSSSAWFQWLFVFHNTEAAHENVHSSDRWNVTVDIDR